MADESAAYATQVADVASLNAGFQTQQAQDLAHDMALLAVTNETPWAQLEADRAASGQCPAARAVD